MNVLEAKDLSFAYGNTPVLDAASFTMCEGGFAALVGVNGAGKSTLLRLLLGELKPTGGHFSRGRHCRALPLRRWRTRGRLQEGRSW